MSSNFSLINDLRMVPAGASFSMLIRHAERGEIKDREIGGDCLDGFIIVKYEGSLKVIRKGKMYPV